MNSSESGHTDCNNKKIKHKKKIINILIISVVLAFIVLAVLLIRFLLIMISPVQINPDESQASQLRTFIQIYLTKSEDHNFRYLLEEEISAENLISRFRNKIIIPNPYIESEKLEIGPYIEGDYNYNALWNPQKGGKHVGFEIIVNVSDGSVQVNPIEEDKKEYTQKEMEGRAHRLVFIKDPEVSFR